MTYDLNINGTMIWYYYICKREVWLISHSIESDQDDENIRIGKELHENAYNKESKEIKENHSIMDMIKDVNGHLLIVEVKKSSKTAEAAKMQLLYYMLELELDGNGIKPYGELRFPLEKKKLKVELTDENRKELEKTINNINEIIGGDIPKLIKNPHCKNCSYSEYCWA